MADNISFRVDDVCQYQSGVANAESQMNSVASDVRYRASEAHSRADAILHKAAEVLRMMQEDYNAAVQVRTHNEGVLRQLEAQLQELNYRYDQLQKAYSRAYEAYRAACAEETRIHNSSVPSTGDEEADKRAREARAKALEAAHKQVRETDRLCYQIKQQMAEVLRQIEETKRSIERVRQIIYNLTQLMSQIQTASAQVESYRNRLQSDVSRLRSEEKRFDSAYYSTSKEIENCKNAASAAITYGRTICNCLDPDQSVGDHDGCYISFTDVYALDRISNAIVSTCDDCEEASEEMSQCVGVHEDTMQDNVISQAAATMFEVRDKCIRKIEEFRRTARNCREASVNLKRYYNLGPSQVSIASGQSETFSTRSPANRSKTQIRYDTVSSANRAETNAYSVRTDDQCHVHTIYNDNSQTWELRPNDKYTVNGYHYKTNQHKQIIQVQGKVHLKKHMGRKKILDHIPNRKPTDDRGHLIADMFDGSNQIDNIVAMDSNVNQKQYYKMEKDIERDVKAGKEVFLKVLIKYNEDGRPKKFIASNTVDGEKFKHIFINES